MNIYIKNLFNNKIVKFRSEHTNPYKKGLIIKELTNNKIGERKSSQFLIDFQKIYCNDSYLLFECYIYYDDSQNYKFFNSEEIFIHILKNNINKSYELGYLEIPITVKYFGRYRDYIYIKDNKIVKNNINLSIHADENGVHHFFKKIFMHVNNNNIKITIHTSFIDNKIMKDFSKMYSINNTCVDLSAKASDVICSDLRLNNKINKIDTTQCNFICRLNNKKFLLLYLMIFYEINDVEHPGYFNKLYKNNIIRSS